MTIKFENAFGQEVELKYAEVAIQFCNIPIGTSFQRKVKGYTEFVWEKISDTEARDASGYHTQEFDTNETVDAHIYVTKK